MLDQHRRTRHLARSPFHSLNNLTFGIRRIRTRGKFETTRVTVSELAIAAEVEAKCVLAGEKDVRQHIEAFTGRRNFHISSIGAKFVLDRAEISGEFTSDGRASVSPRLTTELRAAPRNVIHLATTSTRKNSKSHNDGEEELSINV